MRTYEQLKTGLGGEIQVSEELHQMQWKDADVIQLESSCMCRRYKEAAHDMHYESS
jgi:hypothetical protein